MSFLSFLSLIIFKVPVSMCPICESINGESVQLYTKTISESHLRNFRAQVIRSHLRHDFTDFEVVNMDPGKPGAVLTWFLGELTTFEVTSTFASRTRGRTRRGSRWLWQPGEISLETGPPPSGQLNAGVRRREGPGWTGADQS